MDDGGGVWIPLLYPGSTPPFNSPPRRLRPAPGRGDSSRRASSSLGGVRRHILEPGATLASYLGAPHLRLDSLRSSGSGCPRRHWNAGGGEGFLCLLHLLPHPNSPATRHGGVTGEEPTRASGPHTRPELPPTHCSGRRPAGPAPWPSSGLHRDPRPLRPRRPGPGAAGAHLRRAHDAAAILAASSSGAAPAAAAETPAAAALCSARRGRAGPRWGRHCSAGPGAGPEDQRAELRSGRGAGKHQGAKGAWPSYKGAGLRGYATRRKRRGRRSEGRGLMDGARPLAEERRSLE